MSREERLQKRRERIEETLKTGELKNLKFKNTEPKKTSKVQWQRTSSFVRNPVTGQMEEIIKRKKIRGEDEQIGYSDEESFEHIEEVYIVPQGPSNLVSTFPEPYQGLRTEGIVGQEEEENNLPLKENLNLGNSKPKRRRAIGLSLKNVKRIRSRSRSMERNASRRITSL